MHFINEFVCFNMPLAKCYSPFVGEIYLNAAVRMLKIILEAGAIEELIKKHNFSRFHNFYFC